MTIWHNNVDSQRELAQLRLAHGLLTATYLDLLAAARATIAAAGEGAPNPLFWLREELREHDQLPPLGAHAATVAAQPMRQAA